MFGICFRLVYYWFVLIFPYFDFVHGPILFLLAKPGCPPCGLMTKLKTYKSVEDPKFAEVVDNILERENNYSLDLLSLYFLDFISFGERVMPFICTILSSTRVEFVSTSRRVSTDVDSYVLRAYFPPPLFILFIWFMFICIFSVFFSLSIF